MRVLLYIMSWADAPCLQVLLKQLGSVGCPGVAWPLQAITPPGTKNAQWRTNWIVTQTKPSTAPRRRLSANGLCGLKASFLLN